MEDRVDARSNNTEMHIAVTGPRGGGMIDGVTVTRDVTHGRVARAGVSHASIHRAIIAQAPTPADTTRLRAASGGAAVALVRAVQVDSIKTRVESAPSFSA